MTAQQNKVFKGVVKADILLERMRKGDLSYMRGALQFLSRKPPNPLITPILSKAIENGRP